MLATAIALLLFSHHSSTYILGVTTAATAPIFVTAAIATAHILIAPGLALFLASSLAL